MTTTFNTYSAKDQGSFKKGDLIVSQSLKDFEKYNGKYLVKIYDKISNLGDNRVYVQKVIA